MTRGDDGRASVILYGASADSELENALQACSASVRVAMSLSDVSAYVAQNVPDALVVELGDDEGLLEALAAVLPPTVRLIAIGAPGSFEHASMPDCMLLAPPDEATLRMVLAGGPRIHAETLVRELLQLSIFGRPLAETLQELATRLARAFAADDCILLLTEEATCYPARVLTDDVAADLGRLSQTVCRYPATVIAPYMPARPYRAFLGVPLEHDSSPPLAFVLLCREQPWPFGRDALVHLRAVAGRLCADLSWRLVHERLQHDREKLRELSRVDAVLGVANRTALQEELSRALVAAEDRKEPLSVAVIDVDRLRLINERSGYPAGDAVLAHVAQVVRRETRPQDIVARYAGDSVAIVLPDATAEQAETILTGVLAAIDATVVTHEDRPIHLTVSAGISQLRQDGDDTGEAALARAMAARASARLHGQVIAVAEPTMAADLAQPDFQIGTTLGGVYQIRHEISRGAFGVVYRAEDLALGRQVALKLLRPDLARDVAFVENFRTEAATLARIRHPNLVQVYAFGVDGPNVYFAMELVEGEGLEKRIHSARKRRRHLPMPELLGILRQIGDALDAVHRAGMVHRDVKPENILIDRINRRCVLVDVGIAVRRGERNRAGTPGFTAPEVFFDGAGTPASDVYSLGALTYLLLTTHVPFGDGNPLDILSQQANARPLPLTQLRHDLPPIVDEILLPTLDPDPAQRPDSARKLVDALEEVLADPDLAPRLTMERPAAEPIEPTRPIVAYDPLRAPPSAPSTRGVLFRSAYEALGARRGSAWITAVSRKLPELAGAIVPQAPLLAWHPTSSFVALLQSLVDDQAECRAVAHQLGRTAAEMSFRQFYGANPAGPAQVLRDADLLWRCYHTWGNVSGDAHETTANLTLAGGLASSLLCAATAGLFAGVVTRAGGFAAVIEHPACLAEGAAQCVFRLSWQLSLDDADTVLTLSES